MKYVYESPDGGHTVYRRAVGDTQRELHSQDSHATAHIQKIKENRLWADIRHEAKTNQALHHALEQVKMIYELGRSDNS